MMKVFWIHLRDHFTSSCTKSLWQCPNVWYTEQNERSVALTQATGKWGQGSSLLSWPLPRPDPCPPTAGDTSWLGGQEPPARCCPGNPLGCQKPSGSQSMGEGRHEPLQFPAPKARQETSQTKKSTSALWIFLCATKFYFFDVAHVPSSSYCTEVSRRDTEY